MTPIVTDWSFYCAPCDHWTSTIVAPKSQIENADFELTSDDTSAISHLDSIRAATSEKILNELNKSAHRKLLDVGCAAGVFIAAAGKWGFDPYGIEPNKIMASPGIKQGLNIRVDFFPNALDENEKFEIITFNDVLEHIEDIHTILKKCHEILDGNGYLSIAVPNSNGIFFKLAKIFGKLGIHGPWHRLWQTMFYTPHLHYFSPGSLISVVERHGFKKVTNPISLPVIKVTGLWKRLSVNHRASFATNAMLYFLIIIAYPIYALMPKDSFFIIFEKIS